MKKAFGIILFVLGMLVAGTSAFNKSKPPEGVPEAEKLGYNIGKVIFPMGLCAIGAYLMSSKNKKPKRRRDQDDRPRSRNSSPRRDRSRSRDDDD